MVSYPFKIFCNHQQICCLLPNIDIFMNHLYKLCFYF